MKWIRAILLVTALLILGVDIGFNAAEPFITPPIVIIVPPAAPPINPPSLYGHPVNEWPFPMQTLPDYGPVSHDDWPTKKGTVHA